MMPTETKTPQSVLAMCRELDVKVVCLRFTDLMGRWQWCAVPVGELTEDRFEDGFWLDGSGYAGWQSQEVTDLLLVPQPERAFFDPFSDVSTVNLLCSVQNPQSGEDFVLDPRSVASRAVNFLGGTGLADRVMVGLESEFYAFESVAFEISPRHTMLGLEQDGERDYQDFVGQVMQTLLACGVPVDTHRPASAEAGQFELSFRQDDLIRAADTIMIAKYVIKGIAQRMGKSVTFMPKPLSDHCGSGLHTHLSLWRGGEVLFAGTGYAGLSDAGVGAIGGLLKRLPALAPLTNPSTNSYRRLVPDFDAPVYAIYSQRNRGTAVRIPTYSRSPKTKQIEFRVPDASCNPYLAFSAILMAVIDGVRNKVSPGEPVDGDLRQMTLEGRRQLPRTPESLPEALAALEADHDFLLRGDVFSHELIETWIQCKRATEIDVVRGVPHPGEYSLYYDV